MYSCCDSVSKHTGFPHSDIAGCSGSYHLAGAFRRLARPSSPLTARASTVYAWSLNLTTHRRFDTLVNRDNLETRPHRSATLITEGDRTRSFQIFSLFRIVKEQNFAMRPEVHSEVSYQRGVVDGGAKRDRTADLLRARQALSQLSYSPIEFL